MIYMKGVPEFPQCGFSSLAVRVLKHYSKFLAFYSVFSMSLLDLPTDAFNLKDYGELTNLAAECIF